MQPDDDVRFAVLVPDLADAELFERELTGLVEYLGIAKRYTMLGQSRGGLLGLVHALERPPGW